MKNDSGRRLGLRRSHRQNSPYRALGGLRAGSQSVSPTCLGRRRLRAEMQLNIVRRCTSPPLEMAVRLDAAVTSTAARKRQPTESVPEPLGSRRKSKTSDRRVLGPWHPPGRGMTVGTAEPCQNRWFDDVCHGLMSFGTLRRLPVPQAHGRNWAFDDLPNVRRCFTPTQFPRHPFRTVGDVTATGNGLTLSAERWDE